VAGLEPTNYDSRFARSPEQLNLTFASPWSGGVPRPEAEDPFLSHDPAVPDSESLAKLAVPDFI